MVVLETTTVVAARAVARAAAVAVAVVGLLKAMAIGEEEAALVEGAVMVEEAEVHAYEAGDLELVAAPRRRVMYTRATCSGGNHACEAVVPYEFL